MLLIHRIITAAALVLRQIANTLVGLAQTTFGQYRRFPVAYTAIGYLFFAMAFCYYPISDHWVSGFIMMSYPLAVAGGFVAIAYLFYKRQRAIATAGLIWFVFSFVVTKRLIGFRTGDLNQTEAQTLNVLSFNSETFPGGLGGYPLRADIACFQEYSPNAQLEKQYASRFEKLSHFENNRQVGLALFSNYPIVREYGRIWDRANAPDINGFLCADIAYNTDTIRVVNVHLWSMGVRTDQIIDAVKAGDLSRAASAIWDTFHRMKEGFVCRNQQLIELESYVAGSRYPVIICGDFNETPMSYSYGRLSRNFMNAFEEAGQGLGFTLNRHPYWVRIDQQFVSSDWYVKTCQTVAHVSFSDHFPVLAQYVLKKSFAPASPTLSMHNRAR